ncbi:MAG: hypothetical protein NC311_14455 [Muribaculaceae bacterium]|nr:hypothetical protein [Muribaculaceae bacterium]
MGALTIIAVGLLFSIIKSIRKTSKKRSDVGKIMRTTDGYFANNPNNKKQRNVVVLDQRADDGALAVVKLHRQKDKHTNILKGFVLKKKKHSALTADSVTETRVYVGTKSKQPIFKGDLTDTKDKLTWREKRNLKRHAGGNTKQHRQTTRHKLKRWHNHFRK